MEHVVPRRPTGTLHAEVTPASAGWRHLGFELRTLADGAAFEHSSADHEVALILLAGDAELRLGGERHEVQGRRGVFEGLPHGLYAPPGCDYGLVARGPVEFALGSARADGTLPPRLITPDDVTVEIRGGHNATRQISHVIDPGQAERLLCVEVYTPSGNWSSYPPHKHDVYEAGVEAELDEVYHFRLDPADGWALQRLYNDDRSLDEVVVARDGDTVMVREGYHPVVVAPGYDAYYLNLLAGDHPTWDARDEPDLAWVRGSWEGREGRLRLPLRGSGRDG
ncbi:MAG: 5-deoxy-glucuronate isomerase [Trueperaceae bacterium]|nr:MAG: 5-deoxy-glucuronate isomerase [Trueperaceae bacterium]